MRLVAFGVARFRATERPARAVDGSISQNGAASTSNVALWQSALAGVRLESEWCRRHGSS